ncbi:HSP70-domain-containing protein [Coniochaeta sp. 2T2.1]|nr:HSP70-domain-containing protein [Coniochaeta sp. 2T2.1]
MSDNASATSGPERLAIGVTLGNTNGSIAYTVDGQASVIANEDGDRQIPAILSYVDGEEYYGQQAKNFLVRNPKNTVAYFRDFLGKEFKSIDPTHNHASAHPEDVNGAVAFTIKDKAEEDAAPSTLSVDEITTRYLRRLVTSATEYIGKQVTSAVVTVPTNFTDKQKSALIAAAKAADLEILQLISEPVAAALAYDEARKTGSAPQDKIVVVADLGHTRSDVAIVASRGGLYTILATAHDYEFTGAALDKVLIDHFAKEFLKKYKDAEDPRQNARSLAKLRAESESVKKALSIGTNGNFGVESLASGIDFTCTINRTRYETIGRTVFEGLNRLVLSAVKKAGLDVLDIDEVLLSGGTSNTPRITSNMQSLFPETTTILSQTTTANAVHPSELQVRGAALQANLVQEYDSEDINQSTHAAVTTVPHLTNAIGVVSLSESGEEIFVPIIAPETAVPARRTVQLLAPKDGGDVYVKIVEGNTHIKVTQPEPKTNGTKGVSVEDAKDSDEEDSDEEEEEEKREKVWKIGSTLAEAGVRGVKKGGKVEVTINVDGNLSVTVTAREVGGKGGVRGTLAL